MKSRPGGQAILLNFIVLAGPACAQPHPTAQALVPQVPVAYQPTAAPDEAPELSEMRPSAHEPKAAAFSLAKAVRFLDRVGLAWTREHRCGTCHTNFPYLMARAPLPEAPGPAYGEVRAFFEKRALNWGPQKPRYATEIVGTATVLAFADAHTTGKLQVATRRALDRLWAIQRADGAWDWLKCDWPPAERDDYYGAVLAAIGVAFAPEDYARTAAAKPGMDRLRRYLQANRPPDLHHKAMLLLAATKLDDLMSAAERDDAVKELLAAQRPDGGWSLPSLGDYKRRDGTDNDKAAPSDGYGTGLVVYVLRNAGVSAAAPAIRRGVEWLRTEQRASGRWFTRSLNNDKDHFISNAGTAYAVLALRACEVEPSIRR